MERAIFCGLRDTETTGSRVRVPFICAANERRPGGDWETGCSGYEEKLCPYKRDVPAERAEEAAVGCDECDRKDKKCHSKCFGPPPPLCHTCHKKEPECHKKCWDYKEYETEKHKEWPSGFKQSPHKGPVCCTKCEPWDGQ